jgi:hypothetical protein
MLHSTSESAFARVRRIYGKPALLSGSVAYAVYGLVQIDRYHGSLSHTALNVAAGIVPCALAGCLLALALVPLSLALRARPTSGRGLAVKAVKVSAVLGVVAALVVIVDHLGRAG